ncbi:MAG TPA: heavy metal-associated domain-containing protein [Clostridia bacterium]|nr:heavy metal-associated domain-containing protein [Clostridia bacterium]
MSKQSVYYSLDDIVTRHDAKALKKGIDQISGVISVSVNTHDKKIAVDYDSTGTNGPEIMDKISRLGFKASLTEHEDHIM